MTMLQRVAPSPRHRAAARRIFDEYGVRFNNFEPDELLELVQRLQEEVSPALGTALYDILHEKGLA